MLTRGKGPAAGSFGLLDMATLFPNSSGPRTQIDCPVIAGRVDKCYLPILAGSVYWPVSREAERIKSLLEPQAGRGWDARYVAFFDCFNRQEYYEAHEVLEELWLTERTAPDGAFYKGLIQFAGAFVHLQKRRLAPAASLFRLSQRHIRPYPDLHRGLNVARTLELAGDWLRVLEQGVFSPALLSGEGAPRLVLDDAGKQQATSQAD
jgi:hypothetical protein